MFEEIITLLDPIKGAANSEESLKRFFLNMGWNFDANSGMPIANVTNTVFQVLHVIETVDELIQEGGLESLDKILPLLSSVKSLFENVKGLVDSFDGANLPQEQITEVIQDIPHYLLVVYFSKKHHILAEIFRWIEIIQIKESAETQFNASGKVIRYPYAFEVINFDNLGKFIANPVNALKDIYVTPFDRNTVAGAKEFTDKLFPRLGSLAHTLGANYVYGIKPAYGIDFGSVGNEMADGALSIKWKTPLDNFDFGVTIAYSPRDRGDLGWVIVPYGELTLEKLLGKYFFQLISAFQVGGIIIGNDGSISFDTSGGLAKIDAQLLVKKLPDTDTGLAYLIGEKQGTRLEIGKISIGSSVEVATSGPDFDVHFNIDEAKLVISGGGQDGFMAKILPENGIEIPFDFLIGYSKEKSLYFGVNAGLELALCVHINLLNILRVDEIYLKIKTDGHKLSGEASLSGGVSLGPLDVSFEEIGLKANLDWESSEKNIGFANADLDFKPPNGVGLSVDAEVVKGGGYLFFDTDKEEYGGALQLVFSDFLNLQAIGLITTKMPDGSKGFALLIMITAEFDPGFQLGMGFVLSGVGGILGLNHSMNLEPLKEGVRDGSLASIMFPSDVVANAPRILSDMRRFFPLEKDKFVIGPMAKITYGSPALMSLSLGIIIEIPGNIAIVGILKAALPTEEKSLLLLQINFIGAIEFDKKWAWFFAVIYDSRILTITLEGEMGFVIGWGSTPVFVVTLGGFHPQFQPPKLPFIIAKRITLSILNKPNAKIQVQAYFAVTSNSVQFGVHADLYFGFSACNVNGHLAFDALIQFNPFYFIISISMSVSVAIFGFDCFSVSLSFSLEGTSPWKIKGKGKVKLLFFSVSFDLKKTWGKEEHTSLPAIPIYALIKEELAKKENWKPVLPARNSISVSLKEPDPNASGNEVVLHPAGQLEISQRVVPLGINLAKFGSQAIEDVQKLVISDAGGDFHIKGNAREMFAMAQFLDIKGEEKVKRPSYESQICGAILGVAGKDMATSKVIRRNVRYEEIIIDTKFKRAVKKLSEVFSKLFIGWLKFGAVSQSSRSQFQKKLRQPFEEKINAAAPVAFTIASVMDNQSRDGLRFESHALAVQHLDQLLAGDPTMRGNFHVIHDYEAANAA